MNRNRLLRQLRPLGLLFLALLLPGCSRGDRPGGSGPSAQGRFHPVGWLAAHPGKALASVDTCVQCHSMTVLRAGAGPPSCMASDCHHRTIPGWAVAGSHGARAKMAMDESGGGLASCQLCHGKDFGGGGSAVACSGCHGVPAPHSRKPWHTGGGMNHNNTDPSNAPVCAQCHYPGSPSNPPNHPATPAPAGTQPGCFNNTLCHGPESAPHLLGAVWLNATSTSFHGLEAKKDLLYCQSCHGTPGTPKFEGGAATTKCSSCHTAAKAHSVPWSQAAVATFPGYVPSHRNAGNRDAACSTCHDYTKGRTAPVAASPSCFSKDRNGVACHENGPGQANHAVPFLDPAHFTVAQPGFDSNCSACHAVTGSSPVAAAPLCTVCHQAGSPLAKSSCTSCHSKPPSGTQFPDAAGSHGKHEALAGVTGLCSTCHSGADSRTQLHYDHANGRPGSDYLRVPPGVTAFLATYNAKAGAASFNTTGYTCSNVSCHGAQTTPDWRTGAIDRNAESGCRACHTWSSTPGTPENNTAASGLHAVHMAASAGANCTDCHAMANGSAGAGNHFRFLNTPQMEGPASDTIEPMGNRAYYNVPKQTCGTFTCHGQLHSDYSWLGGANHPVPYLDPSHTTVNTSGFTSNCANCHAENGASPIAAAPLCSTCHQSGSALTKTDCTSCHAKPPSGTAFPEVAGKHAKHNALASVTGACSSCHTGYDSGTLAHYNHANARPGKDALRVPPAPAAFLSAYNAKAGTGTFNPAALTCASVSCHGGLTAPSWSTGSIDPNSDAGCRQCHSLGSALGSPENNSLFSGLHAKHLSTEVGSLCTDCHQMNGSDAGSTNHFRFLDTPQMEGPASSTIAPQGNHAYYNIPKQTCGTFTCHGQLHGDYPWNGGANHPVPYLDPVHTALNQSSFDANCKACHAVTGASPYSGAPACAACHQAASPLAVTNCASCHGKPPAGSAFPDIAGKHAKHDALSGVTGACAVCHNNVGAGTQTHYDHANGRPGKDALRVPPGEVSTLSTYNARTGAASFAPASLTCASVSCHGGITTPGWQTGTIPSDTDAGCRQCHTLGTASGTPQYNSEWSGEHARHLAANVNALCTDCHSMSNGSTGAGNHFRFLATSAMEGPASDTIQPLGVRSYYNVAQQSCGTFTCHGQDHLGDKWIGGGIRPPKARVARLEPCHAPAPPAFLPAHSTRA